MKSFTTITLFLFSAVLCKADYDPTPLANLINDAHLIVECKTVAVHDGYFEVEILDVIKGSQNKTRITVSRFNDWTCASRWARYKVGQTQLLFLTLGYNNIWRSLGAGNEGDMPIEADTVYYKEIYFRIDSLAKTFVLNDGIVKGYKFSLTDVKQGIKQYIKDKEIILLQARGKATRKYVVKNALIRRVLAELKEINSN